MLSVALLPLMLCGCLTVNGLTPIDRTLPTTPAFIKAAIVPEPRADEPLVVIAARERSGRLRNEAVIGQTRDWYADLRTSFATKK